MQPFATITRFSLFLWLALGAFFFSQAQAAPLGSSVTSTGTAPQSSPTFICLKKSREVAGAFIVAATNGTAVSGLQVNDDLNTATLAKEGYIGAWTFNGGAVGAWDYCTYRYLTVDFSGQLSYKPITWSFSKKTTSWIASYGSQLKIRPPSTVEGSSSHVQSLFLACKRSDGKGPWLLFLQTGTDLPLLVCAQTTLWITATH